MSLLNDVDRDYSDNWVISVDKWNSYRSIGYQNKLDMTHIQSVNVSAIGTTTQYASLSGELSAHGDVSGVIGFDPTQHLNYNVDVSLNRFTLNGELQPDLNLYRGLTYNFNQSDIDNSGQRLFVSNDICGRLVASHTYELLAGGNGSENSNTLRGTGGNDGTVSSNNQYSGYNLSGVFNGTLSSGGDGWHTGNNTYPANLIFTFPNPVVIYKYKVWPRQGTRNDTHPPKLWQLRGVSLTNINDYDQNDSSTYTVLHEQNVPQLWNVHWFNTVQTIDITNDTKRQEYIFSTPGLYKHYVFHVIESQYGTTSHTFIGEIAYYGGTPSSYSLSDNSSGFVTTGTLGTDLSSSWTIPTDASDTMYYASDGSDNVGGKINVLNVQYYDLSHVYDNSDNTTYKSPLGVFNNQNLISGKEFAVKVDFQSSKKIVKYDINNTSLKSWTLRGTDNSHNYDRTDSNTYEVLHSKTDFSYIMAPGAGSNIVPSPKDYTYYVLDATESNNIDSALIGELIFYDDLEEETPATNVLNGTLVDASDAYITNTDVFTNKELVSGKEFSIHFEISVPTYITRYRIWSQINGNTNSPSSWTLRGYNDKISYDRNNENTYVKLDIRIDEGDWYSSTSNSITNTSDFNEYFVTNPGYYSYYVIDVTGSNNDIFCSIGELAYYESNYLDVTTTGSGTQYLQHNLTINNGTSNETSDFEVAEIIVFNKELSIDEENTMIDYLKHIYYGADENDPIGNTETLHIPRKNIKMGDIYSILDVSRQTIEYFNKNVYDTVLMNRLINSGEKLLAGAGAIDGTGDLSGNIMFNAFRGALNDYGQEQLFTGDQGSSLLTFTKNLTTLGGYSSSSMIGSGRNINLYLKYQSTETDPGNPVLNEIIVNGTTYALNTTNVSDPFHYSKWQTSVATNNSIYNNYIPWINVENGNGPNTGAMWNYSDVSGLYYEQEEMYGVTGTGGNLVNSYGNYYAHIYTSSGQFTLPSSSEVDFLIVAGGGAGGFALAGGGGGGGVIIGNKYTLPSGTYNITVGAGGIGQNHRNSHAPDGGNSSIIGNGVSFIAPGGGGGGGANNNNVYVGNPGGSGAGHEGWNSDKVSAVAQYYNSSGSLTTLTGGSVEIVPDVTAYGNPGGAGGRGHYPTGGGGAGKPGIGTIGAINVQADGGDGIQNNFYDGTTDYYWAGGGGGTQWSNGVGSGNGGKGGGAAGAFRGGSRGTNSTGPPESLNAATGSADYDGADAGVNTGGGGGGGEWDGGDGGNGGSGIVIIRRIELSAKNLDGVYLKSPPIVVTNDEFTVKMYGDGSGMGTVSVGAYKEDPVDPITSPQKAFNNDVTDGWIGAETILPGFSSKKEQDLIFVFPDEARVSKYRIWARDIVDGSGNPPKSWTLRAEKKNSTYDPHDLLTYDLLDNQTNITSWSIPNSTSIASELDYNEYFISNTEWYQKYILHITDVYWTSVITTTLEVGGGALDGTGGAQGTAHSYASHSNMPDYKAFDGTITNANDDAWHTNEIGGSNYVLNVEPELGFEFPTTETKKITKYRIWARGGISSETSNDNWRPRAWQLRGASSYANYNRTDSSTYTIIDTVASLGAAGDGTAGTSVWPYINSVVTLPDGAGYLEFNIDTPGNYNYYVLHFTESFNWSNSSTSYIALSQIALYSSINTGTVEVDTTPGVGELAYYGYLKSGQTDISSVPIKTTDFLDVSYDDVFGEENQITNTSNIKISSFGGLGGSGSGGKIPVTDELSFWGDAESWIVGTGWTDKSAAGNNIYTGQPGVEWYNSSLTSITNPDVVSENGADNITKVIQGGTNERFRFNTNILTPDTSEPGNPYTFIHIARYNGGSRNRIWGDNLSNHVSGFHGGRAGRGSHINGPGWVGYGWNAGSTGQYVYPTDPLENPNRGGDIDWAKDYWLLTTEQGGLTRWYVKFNAGGYGAPGSNGNLYNNREALHNSQNTESPHISIGYLEESDWQVAFAAVWKRHLTDDEVDLVEAWLIEKYQFNYFNL
tara:strand:+ start:788 stop:6757 length:5970 start_codon:yes stop_codon:yes gene_type:complete